jgi:hypothetical protein
VLAFHPTGLANQLSVIGHGFIVVQAVTSIRTKAKAGDEAEILRADCKLHLILSKGVG